MSELLRRMRAQAVDLSSLGFRRADTLAALDYAHETGQHMWADPALKAAAEIARRYEDNTGEQVRAYAAGWPQLVNWEWCGPDTASNNAFTTLANIGLTQQQNIFPAANLQTPGTYWQFHSFGIVGSVAGTATTTWGINLNGGARAATAAGTAVMISASQTPATSTVNVWRFHGSVIQVTVGSAGTIQSSGMMVGLNATAATNIIIPATQAAAAAMNTQSANYFNPVASWSVSNAGNLYQVNGFAVLQFN